MPQGLFPIRRQSAKPLPAFDASALVLPPGTILAAN